MNGCISSLANGLLFIGHVLLLFFNAVIIRIVFLAFLDLASLRLWSLLSLLEFAHSIFIFIVFSKLAHLALLLHDVVYKESDYSDETKATNNTTND